MLKEDILNKSIEELFESKIISVRAYHCCQNARLHSLNDVLKFSMQGNSFRNVRNAGYQTSNELDKLCKKYSKYLENYDSEQTKPNTINDIDINIANRDLVIIKYKELLASCAVRTKNRLSNLSASEFLEEYLYCDENELYELKNIGKKSVDEIIDLRKKLISFIEIFKNSEVSDESYNDLVKIKYKEFLDSCTARTKNGLSRYSSDEFLKSFLYCDEIELYKIKNIGKKSVDEIVLLREKLISFIKSFNNTEVEESSNYQIIKLKTKYKSVSDKIDFAIDFLERNNHLPMLWLLERYITSNESKEVAILREYFPILQNHQNLSLDDLAEKNNLSRERIRQIRNQVYEKSFEIKNSKFAKSYIRNLINYGLVPLDDSNEWEYLLKILINNNITCHDSGLVQKIINAEECNLSFVFVLQIITYLFPNNFALIGGIEMSEKQRIWNKTYIIKKKYADIFDFEKFRLEFVNIFSENEKEYFMDINDYIANSRCWIDFEFTEIDEIVIVVRDILLHEFGLYSEEIDGQLKIPANKKRNPIDVVYEILKQNGNPMHLDKIFIEFRKILPENKYTEAAQLRPWLQRNESISFRNRSSIYTLKEWKHIRTGTIRDAMIEFLMKHDTPQTAEDITNYLLLHFPKTNISSVRTSMLNDTLKRFTFYGNNLFGLTSKEYPSKYEEVEQQNGLRKTFEQRLIDLEKFIVENEHFPFSSSEDKEEESLCRWWSRIINDKQQISKNQLKEVERVKLQYCEYEADKNTFEWNMNYNKFKLFLIENRRIPLARGKEKFLYGWLRRAKSDFLNDRLSEEQRQKYIELAKLI